MPSDGVIEVAPALRRLRAPNPSPMTERGTNTYLLGTRGVAVIDPGPDDAAHLAAIEAALAPGQSVSHVLVTHAHLDHSPLAPRLAARHGAPVLAFGSARDGMSPVMRELLDGGLAGGGEGIDHAFQPDRRVGDGEEIAGDGWSLTALHTPGHIGNHLCFLADGVALSGDHVMGWATSLVSPPDGDLTDFMASCAHLRAACAARGVTRLLPGHGDPVEDALARIDALVAHRLGREAQILDALDAAPGTADALAQRIYTDVNPALMPAAARNVLAHLIDLSGRGHARPAPHLSAKATFTRA
ncbi:MBL fold metallo-hydrolase [Pseudaestuariivita atlantica]|uniref:Metallo-beta-lactamase n=1 Tax=Pseudaestuariivita atlantica TaxID=1317121 RepID=A0A0L1JM99_9RHOB|nr:MBL fold metallo-hydrolase [Pseudaestuariivita atlantica]KNG92847.1 metallo-beta-lactamase [Pseudaestuariivita atlantica]